ncbi:MAG TPA: BPSS1780 family membrane protein [Burkholderiales bacterium]|nr:BPSS1780 family membrane protein [Burkholderiales bacterium]
MSESVTGGRAVGAGQGWTWIAEGFGLFRKAPGIWIAAVVILFVILIVLAFIPLLGAVATFLVMPVFVGGLLLGCRALQGGGELELAHLFAGFKEQTGNLIVVGALAIGAWIIVMIPVVLIVGTGAVMALLRGDAAGAAAMGGGVLLAWLVALALSIPIYMALWFAPALVVLRGMAPVAALQESFFGCLKNILPFLVYSIVLMVLGIVASIPLGLGWLVLGPTLIASVYVSYRDIFGGD